MAKVSPMQRTRKEIKKKGLPNWIVESWNPWGKVRVDLFNIVDLLVLDDGFLGIQVCGTDWMPHVRKMMDEESENTRAWLENNGRLELWGWRSLKKKRGGKAVIWKPRVADILLVNGELYFEERSMK